MPGVVLALLAASAAPVASETASKPQPAVMVRSPDWLRTPSETEIAGWFPSRARINHIGGRAIIDCAVTPSGHLEDCRVACESPPEYGFGEAALMLAPSFAMRAPTQSGKLVGRARVQTSINFQIDPAAKLAAPNANWTDAPSWSATPTAAQVAAAFPTSEAYGATYGHVVLICRASLDGSVTDCGVVSEAPAGYGFAKAAQRLAGYFKLSEDQRIRGLSAPVYVNIPFDFRDPSVPAPPLTLIDPDWLVKPAPGMAGKLFPEEAAKAGYNTGSATLDCEVAHGGKLVNCAALNENPPGFGFGTAALAVAHVMVMNPWTSSGTPVDGAHISLPIRLNLGG